MNLDDYLEAATDRQSETEVLAEEAIDDVQAISLELLNDPSKRSNVIYDSFIRSGYDDAVEDFGEVAAKAIWGLVAKLVDLPFDELAKEPVLQRTAAWQLAAQIQLAAASQQAQIMSGHVSRALIDGVENGRDLKQATKGLTQAEARKIEVDVTGKMKEKKSAKKKARNGSQS